MDKAILKKFAIESRQDLMEKIKNKINTCSTLMRNLVGNKKGNYTFYLMENIH